MPINILGKAYDLSNDSDVNTLLELIDSSQVNDALTSPVQSLFMWWADNGWVCKFFAALLFGSLVLAIIFTCVAMVPVGIIELIQYLVT